MQQASCRTVLGTGCFTVTFFLSAGRKTSEIQAAKDSPAHTVTNNWEGFRNILSPKKNVVGGTEISP